MGKSLQELLNPPDLDSIRAKMLAKLQQSGLPTTDWNEVGVERALVELFAETLQDVVTGTIPVIAAGGFVDEAATDWLSLLSSQRYNNDRVGATFTKGTLQLFNANDATITVQPDSLWFLFPSGNLYNGPKSDVDLTLPAASGDTPGELDITAQSEQPNHSVPTSSDDTSPLVNYVDAAGIDGRPAIVMTTPIAGVTANNIAPTYSDVVQVGAGGAGAIGTGTVTPSGDPDGPHAISIRVDVSGQVGGALVYSFQVDGGAWMTGQTASSVSVGHSITVTLADGAGTPSFIEGEIYGFTAPGSWITEQGRDEETDPSLQARDKNRWPSLASLPQIPGSPTLGYYDLIVREISTQVTQTLPVTDPTINNRVNIYVAGQGGLLPGSEIARIQAGLYVRNMLTDSPLVLSPTPLSITFGGLTITIKAASLVTGQAQLQAALTSFIASLGLNASMASGKIRHAHVVQIIEDIFGVVDLTDTTLTINGAASSLVLPTVSNTVQLPTWAQTVSTDFTWITA